MSCCASHPPTTPGGTAGPQFQRWNCGQRTQHVAQGWGWAEDGSRAGALFVVPTIHLSAWLPAWHIASQRLEQTQPRWIKSDDKGEAASGSSWLLAAMIASPVRSIIPGR